MSKTIILHLRTGASHPWLTFFFVHNLAVPVIIQASFVGTVTTPSHPDDWIVLPHYSLPLPFLVVHKAMVAARQDQFDTHQETGEDLIWFVALTLGDAKNITISRKVVLKAMCEPPVSVSPYAVGITEVILRENEARYYSFLIARSIMNVHRAIHFYKTIQNFGKVEIHLPKHQEVGEAAILPVKIDHVHKSATRTLQAQGGL